MASSYLGDKSQLLLLQDGRKELLFLFPNVNRVLNGWRAIGRFLGTSPGIVAGKGATFTLEALCHQGLRGGVVSLKA